jgi:dTDP-4-dehydrorhamnose reductase
MHILITGALGRLGSCLIDVLDAQHDLIPADVPEFDIADWSATQAFIADAKPDLVIHPAAWTDVDGCANEPDQAIRINGLGAGNVAVAAANVGAAVVYISSNEVFSGKEGRAYNEYDPTAPANPYGYSKYVGEQAVMRATPRHMIVRIAWLFAHGGKNFVHAILNAASAGKPLRVVTDEIANPTYANDVAQGIAQLVTAGRYGTYHLTNAGYCSRYDFARHILDHAGYASTPIEPITHADWQRPSTPPPFSPLANHTARALDISLRPWQEAVNAFLVAEGKFVPPPHA